MNIVYILDINIENNDTATGKCDNILDSGIVIEIGSVSKSHWYEWMKEILILNLTILYNFIDYEKRRADDCSRMSKRCKHMQSF